MRHLLLIPLICAVFSIAGVTPHPVSTASISLSTTHGASLELLRPPHFATTPTTSSHGCDNLHDCRTLSSIVQSSLLTILACVWFAIHHNIPAPRTERPSEPKRNVIIKAGHFIWDKLLGQRAAMIVLFATLIAPEWMLGNAQLQAHTAWRLAKRLEDARRAAAKTWKNGRRDPADDSTSGGEKLGGPTVSQQEVFEMPIMSFHALEAAELLHKADAPWKMRVR
ncbi:hypothetical protein FIBSPDRAFT_1036162 [Athelia psychrophila]|uniref:Uncharacterized protein n=1 Tax=Athelia psychrophila TaxID=1759441 RepID=A0A166WD76_9AGAM|nr:hypothetical protein FIBSPDRAFT_1036162 [Fibularhizoctonia sp. CBS 109695]